AGPGSVGRHRARGHGAGAVDEERRPCGVLRGLQGGEGSEVERSVSDDALPEPTKMPMHTPHLILNPAWLPPAVGVAHVVVPTSGLLVFLGGQAGHRPDGALAGPTLLEQLDQACSNLVEALAAAGGAPEHLVSMQLFVTDGEEYRTHLDDVGEIWR